MAVDPLNLFSNGKRFFMSESMGQKIVQYQDNDDNIFSLVSQDGKKPVSFEEFQASQAGYFFEGNLTEEQMVMPTATTQSVEGTNPTEGQMVIPTVTTQSVEDTNPTEEIESQDTAIANNIENIFDENFLDNNVVNSEASPAKITYKGYDYVEKEATAIDGDSRMILFDNVGLATKDGNLIHRDKDDVSVIKGATSSDENAPGDIACIITPIKDEQTGKITGYEQKFMVAPSLKETQDAIALGEDLVWKEIEIAPSDAEQVETAPVKQSKNLAYLLSQISSAVDNELPETQNISNTNLATCIETIKAAQKALQEAVKNVTAETNIDEFQAQITELSARINAASERLNELQKSVEALQQSEGLATTEKQKADEALDIMTPIIAEVPEKAVGAIPEETLVDLHEQTISAATEKLDEYSTELENFITKLDSDEKIEDMSSTEAQIKETKANIDTLTTTVDSKTKILSSLGGEEFGTKLSDVSAPFTARSKKQEQINSNLSDAMTARSLRENTTSLLTSTQDVQSADLATLEKHKGAIAELEESFAKGYDTLSAKAKTLQEAIENGKLPEGMTKDDAIKLLEQQKARLAKLDAEKAKITALKGQVEQRLTVRRSEQTLANTTNNLATVNSQAGENINASNAQRQIFANKETPAQEANKAIDEALKISVKVEQEYNKLAQTISDLEKTISTLPEGVPEKATMLQQLETLKPELAKLDETRKKVSTADLSFDGLQKMTAYMVQQEHSSYSLPAGEYNFGEFLEKGCPIQINGKNTTLPPVTDESIKAKQDAHSKAMAKYKETGSESDKQLALATYKEWQTQVALAKIGKDIFGEVMPQDIDSLTTPLSDGMQKQDTPHLDSLKASKLKEIRQQRGFSPIGNCIPSPEELVQIDEYLKACGINPTDADSVQEAKAKEYNYKQLAKNFTVKVDELNQLDTQTFSYFDVLCGDVEILSIG